MKPFTPRSTDSSSPRPGFLRWPRRESLIPWLVGGFVFIFRLASLRDLTNDHYMHLSWAQQVLFGQLPGLDFVDPGMPLAWASSAIVQAFAPGPMSEAALCAVMFGLTAAATSWVTARLTGSQTAGVIAAITAAALVPRLYNYPKLLVPALTMFLIQWYVEDRSRDRRVAIGIGLAAAILFRHDLGLYAVVVATAAIAVTHRDSARDAMRALLWTGAATLIVLLPYLIYVQWSEGLVEHVRRGLEFSKGESHQLQYPWPTFPSLAPGGGTWSREDATALLYYGAWMLPFASLLRLPGASGRGINDRLPLALAATLFLGLYLPIILRHPIEQRLPDIATPLVIVGLFVAQGAVRSASRAASNRSWVPPARVLARLGGVVAIVVTAVAVLNAAFLGQFTRELDEMRIARGPLGVAAKIRSLQQDGTVWPWAKFWPNSGGFPTAVLYVRACTAVDDYVLLTWASPEYFFFSQRKFASGFSMFLPPSAFTTDRDQQFMIARLTVERPPIALVNLSKAEAFERAYPRIDGYISEHYRQAATYTHYDGDEIAISIRKDLRATSTFGDGGWPCGLLSQGATAHGIR